MEEIHRDRAPLIEAAMGADGDLVKPRFARGCRCFAVLLDGAVAGYGWLSTGPEWIGELDVEIRPRKAEAYIWNCVTLDEHRRKGVFRSLVAGIAGAARETGVKRVWIGSVQIPAEKALAPLGFRPALTFRARRFAGTHWMRVSAAEPELGRDSRHIIALKPGIYVRASVARRH